MPARIASRTKVCPKCFEMLMYTSYDVKKTIKKEQVSVYNPERRPTPTYLVEQSYVIWTLQCPTCKHIFDVEKFHIGTRNL